MSNNKPYKGSLTYYVITEGRVRVRNYDGTEFIHFGKEVSQKEGLRVKDPLQKDNTISTVR